MKSIQELLLLRSEVSPLMICAVNVSDTLTGGQHSNHRVRFLQLSKESMTCLAGYQMLLSIAENRIPANHRRGIHV
jgi:hypothetical protein